MPEISVIVPVYKVEPYIHRCIDSILAQTFTDFELILVDDGSPDSCGAICDEYAAKDRRIHVIHQKNGGLSAARNTGIDWAFANSDSEWLSFIDSDDWVHPTYLEKLIQGAEQFDASISQCGFCRTDGSVDASEIAGETVCVTPNEQYTRFYNVFAWGKLYRKEIFSSIRYPVGKLYEDSFIWHKLAFSTDRIAVIQEQLYYYFKRADSIMGRAWMPSNMDRLEAWNGQIKYFDQRKDDELLRFALGRFCAVAKHEYYAIERSDRVNTEEKQQYRQMIESQVCEKMKHYKRQMESSPDYPWCYEIAHPITTAMKSKLRKIIRL